MPASQAFLECRFSLPTTTLSTSSEQGTPQLSDALRILLRQHTVVWLMVKVAPEEDGSVAGQSALKSTTFFSTLEYGAVPNMATDLFLPLIQQLQDEWEGVCKAAEVHLDDRARNTPS